MGDYAWYQQILRNEMDWIPITHQRHYHTQTTRQLAVLRVSLVLVKMANIYIVKNKRI